MIDWLSVRRHAGPLVLAACLCAALAACGKKPPLPPPGSVDADKFLFDRGNEELKAKHWIAAREYFRRIVDTYPRSEYRPPAKLGIGDSYLGEGRIDSLILGANEFREFLTFFPVDRRADYAQYKLGVALSKQVLGPERDQTATKEALAELQKFQQIYPKSQYKPEVDKLYRQTRDRLSDSEFLVGQFYYRIRLYAGTLSRLTELLTEDPQYTRKDQVYFLLGETYFKALLPDQALPYYERLLAEFPASKRSAEAKKRVALIKTSGKSGANTIPRSFLLR
jgi:outer membrane protein assembly factor BamD